MKRLYSLWAVALVMALAACGSPVAQRVEQPAAMPAESTPADEQEMAAADAMQDGESTTDTVMAATEAMTESITGAMMDDTEAATDGEEMGEAEPAESVTDTAMLPAWQQLPLVNARSGAAFALADFAGQTIFVEPMATWCTNCRQQLNNLKAAQARLDGEKVVLVALSVETNLSHEALAQYADAAGFDWTFAVATPELLQELAAIFGRTIANPPATPHFIIRPDGSTTGLMTGIDSPETLAGHLLSAGE